MSRFARALIAMGSACWALGCTTTESMRPGQVVRGDGKAVVYQHPKYRVFEVARASVAWVGLDLVEEGSDGSYLIARKPATPICWGARVGIYVRELGAGSTAARVVSKGTGPCKDYANDLHRRISLELGAISRSPRLSAAQGAGSDGGRSYASRRQPAGVTPGTEAYESGYRRRVAATIGIDDYVSWPQLEGAAGDARRVALALRETGFDEIIEIYDGDATRARILQLIGEDLPARTGREDLIVIFFAGHGQTETLLDGSKRGYIVPVDANQNSPFSTAISMEKLRDLSNRLPAKHVYYAMDSCYSGLGLMRGIGPSRRTSGFINKMLSQRAVQMITAGSEGERAVEIGGGGLFTRTLLEAFSGEADFDADGVITASEIGAFVRPFVTVHSAGRQTPQYGTLEGSGEVVFHLR